MQYHNPHRFKKMLGRTGISFFLSHFLFFTLDTLPQSQMLSCLFSHPYLCSHSFSGCQYLAGQNFCLKASICLLFSFLLLVYWGLISQPVSLQLFPCFADPASCLLVCFLKVETIHDLDLYQTTHCYMSEDSTLHRHHCEVVISHILEWAQCRV